MTESFIGQIDFFAIQPTRGLEGWKVCDGSVLAIQDYQPLFTVIGITWGGDGKTTFALPKLVEATRSVAICGAGQGAGLSKRVMGPTVTGEASVTLTGSDMPAHTHVMQEINTGYNSNTSAAFSSSGTSATSLARFTAITPSVAAMMAYGPGPASGTMNPGVLDVANVGKGVPHENCQPALTLWPYICYDGMYPEFQ